MVERISPARRLQLGPIGFGVAPLGNLYSTVTEEDVEATLSTARKRGIRWFDVAPLYGFGLAEVRLGRFLREANGFDPIVSTKVGRVLEASAGTPSGSHFANPLPFQPVFDYSASGIERSYEESLSRLGLQRVQLLLLHDIDRLHHSLNHRALLRTLLDEALPTLARLKAEGRVNAIGLGINEWDIGYEIISSVDIDCVLLAGRYTLLDSSALTSGFLDSCLRRNISVLAGGVFNGGFLAGSRYCDYQEALASQLLCRQKLSDVCARHGVPLFAAALQFTAAHPAICSIVVGARSAAEVNALLDWKDTPISFDLWSELSSLGLIPPESPILGSTGSTGSMDKRTE